MFDGMRNSDGQPSNSRETQQLHFKDESGISWNDGWVSCGAVRVVRRAGQPGHLADAHLWRWRARCIQRYKLPDHMLKEDTPALVTYVCTQCLVVGFTFATPSSQARMTCSWPSLNLKACPRSLEESNLFPFVSVPVQQATRERPFRNVTTTLR